MKRSLSSRQCTLVLILFTALSVLTLLWYGRTHQDSKFRAFAQTFFLNEVQANPIHFHYTIDNPSAYGVDESSLTLPVYQPGDAASEVYALSLAREELGRINPEALNEENRQLYELLDSYLAAAASTAAYPYFSDPLSPSSGVPSELPILFSEYRLDDKADIENYLSILTQIPAYFEALHVYEQEKADAGLFMSDLTADRVIRQCSGLLDAADLKSGSHFLEITFKDRLQQLAEKQILTDEEVNSYVSEHNRLLTTVVAPAYDRLADGLTVLKGSGKATCGLAGQENGRDYYRALVRLRTGSYRDIDEIKRLLAKDLRFNYESLFALLAANPALKDMITETPSLLPEMTPEEILADLQSEIGREYPPIPAGRNSAPIRSTIKYVDASLEAYSAPAFYMMPPIDNICNNLICLNARMIWRCSPRWHTRVIPVICTRPYTASAIRSSKISCPSETSSTTADSWRAGRCMWSWVPLTVPSSWQKNPIPKPPPIIRSAVSTDSSGSGCIPFWISPSIMTTPPLRMCRSSVTALASMTAQISPPSTSISRRNRAIT